MENTGNHEMRDTLNPADVNTRDRHGYSRLLIEAQAHVNVCDKQSTGTPLTYSIKQGNLALAKLLIDSHAGVNLRPQATAEPGLHCAAERGDVNAAKLLIDAKADMNCSVDNRTSLGCAVKNGQLEMMELLLDAKASVDGGNRLALLCATRSGNAKAVQIVLDAKASLEIRDRSEAAPLLIAISNGYAPVVTALLASKAALVSPPGSDDPLTVAVRSGNTNIMKILIDAKAPLEAAASELSALLLAMEYKKLSAMRLLLEAKAATDIPGTDYGSKLLSHAVHIGERYQNDNALKMLLAADPSLASKQHSSRFLGYAYKKKRFSTLQLLLEAHASVDGVTVDGVPILYRAVSDHMTPIVKLIIDAKANLNVRGPEWNDTPLIIASRRRFRDVVELLLEAKANPDAKDCYGHAALHHAVHIHRRNRKKYPINDTIVQMLVDAKAPLEFSALRIAVWARQSGVVKMLVDAKADLCVRDTQGETLLMLAVKKRSTSIVDILLTADPALPVLDEFDSNGMTPLMLAVIKYRAPEDARIVRMLLEHAWAHCAAQSDDEPPAKRFKRTK